MIKRETAKKMFLSYGVLSTITKVALIGFGIFHANALYVVVGVLGICWNIWLLRDYKTL